MWQFFKSVTNSSSSSHRIFFRRKQHKVFFVFVFFFERGFMDKKNWLKIKAFIIKIPIYWRSFHRSQFVERCIKHLLSLPTAPKQICNYPSVACYLKPVKYPKDHYARVALSNEHFFFLTPKFVNSLQSNETRKWFRD